MDDGLDIPAFLRIPQERRAQAWLERKPLVPPKGHNGIQPNHVNGPGSVCRRAGIPDGIDQGLVEHVEMLAAVKEFQRKASLYAMVERKQKEQAECATVRATARAIHKRKKRLP